MTIIRWVFAVVILLLGGPAGAAYLVSALHDDREWLKVARRPRQLAWTLMLMWFNTSRSGPW